MLTWRPPPENAKDVLCKNVTIYGYCRYENKGSQIGLASCSHFLMLCQGCAFNHDPNRNSAATERSGAPTRRGIDAQTYAETTSTKTRFNVDSPSFRPSTLAPNGTGIGAKSFGLSPKAANATPFEPGKGYVPGRYSTIPSGQSN